jgi:hypothetical protein
LRKRERMPVKTVTISDSEDALIQTVRETADPRN